MKKFKLAVLILCMVAMATAFMGCGKKDPELTVWSLFGAADADYWEEIVEAYNATDPDMKVRNVLTPDFYTAFLTATSAGNSEDLPDLITLHTERVALFKDQGIIESMDAIVAPHSQLSRDGFLEQVWDAGLVDGAVYSVPLDVHSSYLYYNKDLVEQYGNPDTLADGTITIDEMIEIGERAAADGYVTFPVSHDGWTTSSWAAQHGGKFFEGNTPTLNTPEMAKGFEEWKRIRAAGISSEDGDDAGQLFLGGQSLFIQEGTWFVASLEGIDDLNFEWGVAHTPLVSADAKPVNWTSSHAFSVPTKERSEEVDVAIGEFLDFVRQNAMMWAASGQNAASTEVFESPEYSGLVQSFLMGTDEARESLAIYSFMNNGTAWDALGQVNGDIIFDRIPVEEGLAQAQQVADDMIAQRGE